MANQDDRDPGFFDRDKVVALMSELAEAMAADGIGAKIVIVRWRSTLLCLRPLLRIT